MFKSKIFWTGIQVLFMNITVLITKLDAPTGQQRDPNYRNGNRMTAPGHEVNSGHNLTHDQPPSNVRQNNGPNNRSHKNENFQ